MARFDTVLLDLDGTLTDSAPGILNCVEYALKKYGFTDYRREDLNPFIGPPLIDSFERFIPCSHEDAVQCLKYYRERFTDIVIFENSVYPGIEEFLSSLKAAGIKILLATAKPEGFSVRILEHFGIAKYFDAMHGATMSEERNTKDAVIAWALTHSGSIGRAVMIGDRENDITGAKLNNLPSIGVLWGYGDRKELTDAGADYIVDNIASLTQLIKGE